MKLPLLKQQAEGHRCKELIVPKGISKFNPTRRRDDLAEKTLQPARKELKYGRVVRPFGRGIVNDSCETLLRRNDPWNTR